MGAAWPRARGTTTALAAALVAGALVRAWRVTVPGLTSDEAFSWRLTGYPMAEMLGRAARDVHPPLYYVVLDGWLGLFGDGPLALRGLSMVAGLLVIPLVFLLVQEAGRLDGGARSGSAGALAAALIALHATQVVQSRNARMYALGSALAAASAWLLLRARRATVRPTAWWIAWGLTCAAAVGTHYYLAFTVLAQAAWAIAHVREARTRTRDLVAAAAVAAAAFAPWANAFWRQAAQVRGAYWIPAPTTATVVEAVGRWAIPVPSAAPGLAPVLAVLAAALLLAAAARAGRAGRFFALQAMTPWVLGIVVSALTGRPILLERYMLFAQVFLLCAWAVTVTRFDSPTWRLVAGAASIVILAATLAGTMRAWPSQPAALAVAARGLKRNVAEGDLIVVESPRVLNKLRYYARQAEAGELDVRAAFPERVPLSPYVSHVVSLTPSELIPADGVFVSGARTVWVGRESTSPPDPPPAGWDITFARVFEGSDETRFRLARYERARPVP
jgi:mannosyltransferase